jgi:hypothetical protein
MRSMISTAAKPLTQSSWIALAMRWAGARGQRRARSWVDHALGVIHEAIYAEEQT